MAVGVVVQQAVAQPEHLARAQRLARAPPRPSASRPAGVAVGVEQALAGGQHRALAVVVERAALQDEVVGGRAARRRPRRSGRRRVSSPSSTYLPPQPLKRKPGARAAVGAAAKIGPVSRSQMSPNAAADDLDLRRLAQQAARRLGLARREPASAAPARRRGRPGRGPGRRPRPARRRRSSSHSSAWLGKPSHMARCGAHSAGTVTLIDAPDSETRRGRAQMGRARPAVKRRSSRPSKRGGPSPDRPFDLSTLEARL